MLNITQCGVLPVAIVLGPVPACHSVQLYTNARAPTGNPPTRLRVSAFGGCHLSCKERILCAPLPSKAQIPIYYMVEEEMAAAATLHTDSEIHPYHRTTEPMKLEKTSEMLESNLCWAMTEHHHVN